MTRKEAIDAAVRRVWDASPTRRKFLASYCRNPHARYPESSLLWLITFVDLVGDEYHKIIAGDASWRTGQTVPQPVSTRAFHGVEPPRR